MLKLKQTIIGSIVLSTFLSCFAPAASAGPLYDWLWNRRYNRRTCCFQRQPACPQPGMCTTTCNQTCQRVVVNYVPYTAYRTEWEQVPVTQYQQTSSTDPCTGCTVTCMRPCTSYTWQMKRVPYTTYRPVYRTETYTVPVTYTSMAPSTCATCPTGCATYPTAAAPQVGCSTCATGYPVAANTAPTIVQQNGYATGSAYTAAPTIIESSPQYQNYQTTPGLAPSQAAPADQVPSLGKPIIIDRREITPQSSTFQSPSNTNTGLQGIRPIRDPNPQMRGNQYVPVTPTDDLTAQAPTRQRWDYSTVRLASYSQPAAEAPRSYQGQVHVESQPTAADPSVNSAWRNMD